MSVLITVRSATFLSIAVLPVSIESSIVLLLSYSVFASVDVELAFSAAAFAATPAAFAAVAKESLVGPHSNCVG